MPIQLTVFVIYLNKPICPVDSWRACAACPWAPAGVRRGPSNSAHSSELGLAEAVTSELRRRSHVHACRGTRRQLLLPPGLGPLERQPQQGACGTGLEPPCASAGPPARIVCGAGVHAGHDPAFVRKWRRCRQAGTGQPEPPLPSPTCPQFNNSHGALGDRARKLDQGILIIRFEMPFNVWCSGCNHLIGKGVRFNAEKRQVGQYHSTRVWAFTMRAPCCQQQIVVHTDPKHGEYVVVSGARRCEGG